MIKWSATDDARAQSEGWGLFATDKEGHASLELQADFESGVFTTGDTAHDNLAWCFVYEQANKGSEFHRKALNYVEQEAPEEYALIMEYVNANSPTPEPVG